MVCWGIVLPLFVLNLVFFLTLDKMISWNSSGSVTGSPWLTSPPASFPPPPSSPARSSLSPSSLSLVLLLCRKLAKPKWMQKPEQFWAQLTMPHSGTPTPKAHCYKGPQNWIPWGPNMQIPVRRFSQWPLAILCHFFGLEPNRIFTLGRRPERAQEAFGRLCWKKCMVHLGSRQHCKC